MSLPVFSVFARDGRFSVCTSLSVVCHNVDRERAQIAIGDVMPDATVQEINQLLNHPSDAATFRATWTQAVSGTLQFLETQVAALPTTDSLAVQFTVVSDSIAELGQQVKQEQNYIAEIHTYLAQVHAYLEWQGRLADYEASKAREQAESDKLIESIRSKTIQRRKELGL